MRGPRQYIGAIFGRILSHKSERAARVFILISRLNVTGSILSTKTSIRDLDGHIEPLKGVDRIRGPVRILTLTTNSSVSTNSFTTNRKGCY
jgi:hypothetical protein